MKRAENVGLDYAGGNIGRLFAKMFFPTLLGLLFNALITIVDGVFVGQGGGPEGIAAVNIVAPLYMVVTGCGLMLGIGSSVVASIAIARKDSRIASVNVTQAFVLSAVFVTVLTAVLLLWPESVVRAMGCSDVLLPGALDYLLWLTLIHN